MNGMKTLLYLCTDKNLKFCTFMPLRHLNIHRFIYSKQNTLLLSKDFQLLTSANTEDDLLVADMEWFSQ